MGTVIDRIATVDIDRDDRGRGKNGKFQIGNTLGFQKGNRTTFKHGHKPHPPFKASDEFSQLKRRLASALKREYGPDLTGKQLAYISAAADAGARLQLLDVSAHPLAIANLMDAQRHALQALEGE
jgi:hypothetical protein